MQGLIGRFDNVEIAAFWSRSNLPLSLDPRGPPVSGGQKITHDNSAQGRTQSSGTGHDASDDVKTQDAVDQSLGPHGEYKTGHDA